MRPTISLLKSKIRNGFIWRGCTIRDTGASHHQQNFIAIRELSCRPAQPWNSSRTKITPFMSTPCSRQICLFSTSNNKKASPNSEPHINDAKARPAEQGLRLDDIDTTELREPESEIETQLRTELSKTVSENATLLAKSRDFEDKYLRALAETENVRNRLTKQIKDAKIFAIQGFCKDLTDIEDILRMAIDSVPQDQITGDNNHLKQLYEGLKMTDARLLQVFSRHGLTQINPVDAKFDPNEHEAVVQQEIPGTESGTVIFVSKIGYKLHDRVIRPAVVGVAK